MKRFSFAEVKEKLILLLGTDFAIVLALWIYCGVIYLQIQTSIGIRVCFLAAKTKVAHFKEVTIPRLVLLGCVLLSDLIRQVDVAIFKRVLSDKKLCWTDSEVALCWLKEKYGSLGLKIVL